MTKVQATFGLSKVVGEAEMAAISRASSVYGIQSVKLAPSLDSITVGYDATRFNELALENALIRCGVPIKRKDIPVGPAA